MTAPLLSAACMAALLLASGCQVAPAGEDYAANLDDRTRSVVMNYLIARGMAESYLTSGRATRTGLTDLVRSNHAALIALRTEAKAPNWTDLEQADGAVRSLIDVTTALDGAAAPAHGSAAASR